MANVRIKLSSTPKVNGVDTYADIDLASENVTETLYDRNAIRNSISNILKWKPYERILNPSFGNSLWNNVFDMVNSSSRDSITSAVRRMLSAEPRIKVESVSVVPDPTGSSVNISFSYTIPTLGTGAEQYNISISRS